jgi:hypothetical protein
MTPVTVENDPDVFGETIPVEFVEKFALVYAVEQT